MTARELLATLQEPAQATPDQEWAVFATLLFGAVLLVIVVVSLYVRRITR